LHDDHREEIELHVDKKEFSILAQLFEALQYKVEIKWFRKRHTFTWEGISVMVDHTKGYGYILELELLTSDEKKDVALQKLREKLASLHIEETPKEIFKEKFAYYKENWKDLI